MATQLSLLTAKTLPTEKRREFVHVGGMFLFMQSTKEMLLLCVAMGYVANNQINRMLVIAATNRKQLFSLVLLFQLYIHSLHQFQLFLYLSSSFACFAAVLFLCPLLSGFVLLLSFTRIRLASSPALFCSLVTRVLLFAYSPAFFYLEVLLSFFSVRLLYILLFLTQTFTYFELFYSSHFLFVLPMAFLSHTHTHFLEVLEHRTYDVYDDYHQTYHSKAIVPH